MVVACFFDDLAQDGIEMEVGRLSATGKPFGPLLALLDPVFPLGPQKLATMSTNPEAHLGPLQLT